MFDLGWSELMVIAIVAIVVIGPKDMPQAFRMVGQWVSKARALAREFQGHLDDLMRETQVDDMKREFQSMTRPPEGLEDELMAGTSIPSKPSEIKTTAPGAAATPASPPPPVIPPEP